MNQSLFVQRRENGSNYNYIVGCKINHMGEPRPRHPFSVFKSSMGTNELFSNFTEK